jgi:glycosyltransferase involved in cell wall biosynthesis
MFRAAVLPRQDVIVCLTTPPYIVLAGLLQKLFRPKTRLVLWNMDCYPEAVERTGMLPAGGLVSDILRGLNRAIFRRIDHLICLDSAMKDLLLSQYKPHDRELPCEIIPNWERLSVFPAESRHKPWNDPIIKSLQDRFVVLYLGNAGYGHEFATAIEAADRLRDEPITFLFVGGGAMRGWIEARARNRGLSNFLFHDYVAKEQTPSVMAMADCALITLENYAAGVMSPSKLHSNLAMGLPILYIGPARTNVDEAIARFACGTSVRPGDVERTVKFLRDLMHDREKQAELRRCARNAFEEAYCDRQMLPRFDAVFARLCDKAARGNTSTSASH